MTEPQTTESITDFIQREAKKHLSEAEKILGWKNKTASQLSSALEAKTKADALYELLFALDFERDKKHIIKPCGGD